MLVTIADLHKELTELKSLVQKLLQRDLENNLSEISLNKACRILKLGSDTVKKLADEEVLKSRRYKDARGKLHYRFAIRDIYKYQNQFLPDPDICIKTPEEIFKESLKQIEELV